MSLSKSYIAGLFDGEGCIFIQCTGPRKGGIPYYTLRATINMVHKPIIEMLAEQFDASIIVHRKDKKNPKHRVSYEMCLNTTRARDFLAIVYDELVVKKEEARLAIEFQNHMNEYRHKMLSMSLADTQKVIEYRERLRLRVKELKRVSVIGATEWNAGEPGGNPMPDLFTQTDAEGQYRTKQELTTPGVCNEQVPASKEKVCSELHGNMQSEAEMTSPNKLRLVS